MARILHNDVVVVGHGFSSVGAGLGEKIDSFRDVIRMQHSGIHKEDLGCKTSFFCVCDARSRKIKVDGVKPIYETWCWGRPYVDYLPAVQSEMESRLVDFNFVWKGNLTDRFANEFKKLGATKFKDYKGQNPIFSGGAATVLIAIAETPPGDLTVVGFDNLVGGENKNSKGVFNQNLHKNVCHDYKTERKLLEWAMDEFDTKLLDIYGREVF